MNPYTDRRAEFSGTLLGFDDFVSMCYNMPGLLDADLLTIYQIWCWRMSPNSTPPPSLVSLANVCIKADLQHSDYTGATTKLPKILLNGNNICMASHIPWFSQGLILTSTLAHPRWHA